MKGRRSWCEEAWLKLSLYCVTILPQLSLAALMADHVIGVYENKSFDIPMQIGG